MFGPLQSVSKYRQDRILLLLLVFCSICLWPFLRYHVANPDSYQYMRLAQHLVEGRFIESVNGYWSPMISWFMAPFFLIGMDPVDAFKLVQLLIAAFTLQQWIRVVNRFSLTKLSGLMLKAVAIPFVLSYGLLTLTPDLLFLGLTLSLLHHALERPLWVADNNYRRIGWIGAGLYLSKSFGIVLFPAFVMASLLYQRRLGPVISWKPVMRAMLLFTVVCGGWTALLSFKYGHLTVSESARFNDTREVAPVAGIIRPLPVLSAGLTEPTSAFALSAWENPMSGVQLTQLRPCSKRTDLDIKLAAIRANGMTIWYYDFRRQAGMFFIWILAAYLLLNRRLPEFRDPRMFFPALTLLLFYGGYSLIIVHTRYVWICTWMLLLLSISMLGSIEQQHPRLRPIFRLVSLVVLLLAAKRPVKELLFSSDVDVSSAKTVNGILHPAITMEQTYADDRMVRNAAAALGNSVLLDGDFASRKADSSRVDRYPASLEVALRCNRRYFGQVVDRYPGMIAQLRSKGVEYFLVWDDAVTMWEGVAPVFSCENLRVFPVPAP